MRRLHLSTVLALALFASASSAAAAAHALVPITFTLSTGVVPAQVDPDSVEVLFNPKEFTITKAMPWDKRGLDAPALEFTSGEPYRVQFELFFDRYDERKSVREYTDQIEALALVHPEKHRPPTCILEWGSKTFECVLETIEVRYTLFLDDGTPVRAVTTTVWKELSPVRGRR